MNQDLKKLQAHAYTRGFQLGLIGGFAIGVLVLILVLVNL